jgi:hypothetical protein
MSFIKTITGISEFGYDNNPILSELDEVIIEGKNLFYPSCGNDINDLLYVNSKRMPQIELYIPEVFIHVDFVVDGIGRIEQDLRFNFTFERHCQIQICNSRSQCDKLSIYKLKNNVTKETSWFVLISGSYNEDVLKALVKNKIKITLLYSICDGITLGMGGVNEYAIPTLLYPIFKKVLGFSVIITDQIIDPANTIHLNAFKKGLAEINRIKRNLFDQAWINDVMDDIDFINQLKEIYIEYSYEELNKSKLDCYSRSGGPVYLLQRS